MAVFRLKKLLSIFLILSTCLFFVQCTSSDGDTSVLEEELENIDEAGLDEEMADDIDDLDEVSDEDLEDIVEDEDNFDEDLVSENDEDEDIPDEDDFEDEEKEKVADNEDEINDKEFAEFEDAEEKTQQALDQSEKGLADEIKGQGDYPVAQNAEPQFPEEIVGSQGMPPGQGDPMSPPGPPMVASDTQEVAVVSESVEPLLPQDDLGDPDPIVEPDDDDPMEQPSWIPVVKVKTDPFYRNQRLMNAVYIARPGDDMTSISEKIYQQDKVKELSADNPHLAKGIDPGDKVYYNSPVRPDDRSSLKVFYADTGLPAQYYQTQNNDNMRRLGSKLLGFPEGWKEIWAINQAVDSKTILPSGIELRYWTGNEQAPGLEIAANDEDAPIPSEPEIIEENEEPTDLAQTAGSIEDPFEEDLPPEPPMPDTQVAAMPEPEPIPDIEPFPEEGIEQTPGPVAVAKAAEPQGDSLLSVAAIALLGMAMVGLVAIQIKKRKDKTGLSPQSLEYTQA